MTRDDWVHDLRAVDEVVIESGERMQDECCEIALRICDGKGVFTSICMR